MLQNGSNGITAHSSHEAMEHPWQSSLLLPVAVALAFIVVWATLRRCWAKRSPKRNRVPPGRLGFPIIGETLEFLRMKRENRLKDFYGVREERYGEVFRTSLYGDETISLPPPFGNKFLFTSENSLVLNRWPSHTVALLGKHSISVLTGDDHKYTKGVLMAFLCPDALQRYVDKVCEVAEKHIANFWEGRSQVVVHPLTRRFTLSVACSLFVSLDDKNEQTKLIVPFAALSAGLFQLPIDLPWTMYGKAKLGRFAIHKELDKYIAERKKQLKDGTASPDQDLLSSLLTTPDGNGNLLIDDAVKDNILFLLFAGHETTASTLSLALMFLSRNPDSLQQMLKEQLEIKREKKDGEGLNWEDLKKMKYSWRVLQETLRMYPPAQGGFRKAKVDFEFAGYSIPRGCKVILTAVRCLILLTYIGCIFTRSMGCTTLPNSIIELHT
ncbi:hypothetical protein O6H91_05G011400 [Diphasiastrum complanatum]|uniref:Uncharacterized protein n=1 Tax=Diphasiastrum complanatum TaxID=34168 RepID=A0ACC2DKS4_DIPCM|nr:hypothetical protein O6H91_05G011400 [Diphasiastrum complanatum]